MASDPDELEDEIVVGMMASTAVVLLYSVWQYSSTAWSSGQLWVTGTQSVFHAVGGFIVICLGIVGGLLGAMLCFALIGRTLIRLADRYF